MTAASAEGWNTFAANTPAQTAPAVSQAPAGQEYLDVDAGGAQFGVADGIGLTADIAGVFDPTPISDGVSGIISLGKGDLLGAGLSVASMIPYLGDAAAKPIKIAKRVTDAFPALARLVNKADGVESLLSTLKHLGSGITNPTKVGRTLNALGNLQDAAEVAYKNPKWLQKAQDLKLPTEGPIPFVPPKNWNVKSPLRTEDKKGFIDAFGNEWRKGPSRTAGEPFEWDVVPRGSSSLKDLSRDGTHLNVSLGGRITHR